MGTIHDSGKPKVRYHALSLAAAALCAGLCGTASAFEIDTGNEDTQARFDTTVRYNFGKRVGSQDSAILGNANFDDGDRNFANDSTINNRLDLLSELDIVYKKKSGVRLSVAAWYDQAYSGGFANINVSTSNHLVNGVPALGLSNSADRFYHGPSGEILDAFVFGGFDVGTVPVNLRVGRHTVNWGESLLGGGAIHGVTYGQAPLDQAKALAMPGVEAKELFRPLNQISGTAQVTPELSLAAQYYLQWEATRIPEAGTYLGFSDSLDRGGESIAQGAARFLRRPGGDLTPKDQGSWGLAARWSPEWLDGTAGVYLRNFSDNQPQAVLVAPTPTTRQYTLNYGGDVSLLGFSLSKQVAGISVGADVNWRRNMPLVAGTITATGAQADALAAGEMFGPRGDTFHAVLNGIGSIGATPLWNSASWSGELTYSRWLSVSQGEAFFKGNATYVGIDRVTDSNWALALNFTPTWFQVIPGADLSLPLSYSRGIRGNSSVGSGGNEGAGSWAAGLSLDLNGKYRFDLKYVNYFGDHVTNAAGAVQTANGTQALLKDRGAVYLTFKTTF